MENQTFTANKYTQQCLLKQVPPEIRLKIFDYVCLLEQGLNPIFRLHNRVNNLVKAMRPDPIMYKEAMTAYTAATYYELTWCHKYTFRDTSLATIAKIKKLDLVIMNKPSWQPGPDIATPRLMAETLKLATGIEDFRLCVDVESLFWNGDCETRFLFNFPKYLVNFTALKRLEILIPMFEWCRDEECRNNIVHLNVAKINEAAGFQGILDRVESESMDDDNFDHIEIWIWETQKGKTMDFSSLWHYIEDEE